VSQIGGFIHPGVLIAGIQHAREGNIATARIDGDARSIGENGFAINVQAATPGSEGLGGGAAEEDIAANSTLLPLMLAVWLLPNFSQPPLVLMLLLAS
jgi:hypothetical protein